MSAILCLSFDYVIVSKPSMDLNFKTSSSLGELPLLCFKMSILSDLIFSLYRII